MKAPTQTTEVQAGNRYARQTALPEVGTAGQARLQATRALIVGLGGLGSPVALYLAAAGVGTLGLADDDTVSQDNLQRQVLYTEAEVGQPKVRCATRRLLALNSTLRVEEYPCRIDRRNAADIVRAYDMVVDGCDNFATRYLLSDTCATLHIPYIYGAIRGFEGQVSVLCHGQPMRTYRDLYPDEAAMLALAPDKAVLGVTPAVTGSVEAAEALKIALGCGEPLVGRLWTIDLQTMQTNLITF